MCLALKNVYNALSLVAIWRAPGGICQVSTKISEIKLKASSIWQAKRRDLYCKIVCYINQCVTQLIHTQCLWSRDVYYWFMSLLHSKGFDENCLHILCSVINNFVVISKCGLLSGVTPKKSATLQFCTCVKITRLTNVGNVQVRLCAKVLSKALPYSISCYKMNKDAFSSQTEFISVRNIVPVT